MANDEVFDHVQREIDLLTAAIKSAREDQELSENLSMAQYILQWVQDPVRIPRPTDIIPVELRKRRREKFELSLNVALQDHTETLK